MRAPTTRPNASIATTALIDEMLADGRAYKCYCSKERLEALREGQMANGEKPRYDGKCRDGVHDHRPMRRT